jgi:hypothetical protein
MLSSAGGAAPQLHSSLGCDFFCFFARFFLICFPLLGFGFDGFHWYLLRFAAKLSDLHGPSYIWSMDPPGA